MSSLEEARVVNVMLLDTWGSVELAVVVVAVALILWKVIVVLACARLDKVVVNAITLISLDNKRVVDGRNVGVRRRVVRVIVRFFSAIRIVSILS